MLAGKLGQYPSPLQSDFSGLRLAQSLSQVPCLSSCNVFIHITKKLPQAPNQDSKEPRDSFEEQCALGYRQAGIQLLPAFLGALSLELVLKLLQGTRISHASHWRIRKQMGQLFSTLYDQDTKQIWHIFYLLLTSD